MFARESEVVLDTVESKIVAWFVYATLANAEEVRVECLIFVLLSFVEP